MWVLVAFAYTGLAPCPAWAQDPDPVYDMPGFAENRAYEELAPFENIDTLTGNVMLIFTDLVLPGDAGYDLKIQRTYNAKPGPAGFFITKEWEFGIEGVPMRVIHMPSDFPASDPELYWPVLRTVDGSDHKAIPLNPPSATSTLFRTREFWVYRSTDRTVRLPNGLTCHYDADGFLIEIQSPFDTIATLSWTGSKELATITQHVAGRTRAVTFSSGATTQTMTYGGRTWTYTFSGRHLTRVQPPAGPAWDFTYHTSIGFLQPIASVTTPSGGRISYLWDFVQFRSGRGTTVESWALTQRSTSLNVPTGTWTYAYAYDSVRDRSTTTVVGPENVRKRYEYRYLQATVPVLVLSTVGIGASIAQSEETTYVLDAVVGWRSDDQTLRTKRIIERDGRAYTTEYAYVGSLGNMGQPSRIDESGHFTRTTTRTYDFRFRDCCSSSVPYLPSLIEREVVSAPSNESFERSAEFDGRGFKTRETIHGIAHRFARDQRGNVTVRTNELNHATRFTYAWGVEEDVTTPEYVIQRTINSDSTIASERRNGDTTSYQYDALFRRTRVAPPVGFATETAFNGGSSITVRRGSTVSEYSLDGFGRPVFEEDGSGVRRSRTFDAYGRLTFESLPFRTGSSGPGTTWAYDALGRTVRETYADSTQQTFDYRPNGVVDIRDAQSRVTRQEWVAAGNPDEARLASLTDAASSTFSYSYNTIDR